MLSKIDRLMLICVAGITINAYAMSEEPASPPEPWSFEWLKQANPKEDAQQALSKGNTKLYAIATRSPYIPGIEQDLFKSAQKNCGIQYIQNMGDTLKSETDLQKHQLSHKYAETYNSIVLKSCLRR